MQTMDIVKGTMMAASISLLLLCAKMANAEESINIPTLKVSITKGEIVQHNMIDMQPYKGQTVPAFIVADPGRVIGLEATRNIRSGMPLYRSQFREVPTVKKGEMTTVVFKKGKVRLTTDGLVMADAGTGDYVKVLNKDSKTILHGIVLKNGSILVN